MVTPYDQYSILLLSLILGLPSAKIVSFTQVKDPTLMKIAVTKIVIVGMSIVPDRHKHNSYAGMAVVLTEQNLFASSFWTKTEKNEFANICST